MRASTSGGSASQWQVSTPSKLRLSVGLGGVVGSQYSATCLSVRASRRHESGGRGSVACGGVRRSAGAAAAGLEAPAVRAQPQQAGAMKLAAVVLLLVVLYAAALELVPWPDVLPAVPNLNKLRL